MKGPSDSTPLVPIVVGVLGLLAAGIAFRHCGTSATPDSAAGPQLASNSLQRNHAPGGWIAQPGQGGSGSERSGLGTSNSRMAGSGSVGTTDRGSGLDDLAPPRGGSVRGSAERDFRDTDTTDVGGDPIAAPRRAPAADGGGNAAATGAGADSASGHGQGQGAKATGKGADAPGSEEIANAQDTPKTPGAQDDKGLVLSLPSEKPLASDQASLAPAVVAGVSADAEGANFSANSQVVFPTDGNVNGAAGTFTFWILPDWAGQPEGDAGLVHIGGGTFGNHVTFFKNGRYLRFLFADNTGYESNCGRNVTDWKPGDRHMITGTWGDGITVLYLDGESVDASDYSGELDLGPNPPIVFGSGRPGEKAGASSKILGHPTLYQRALSADEVAALYVQGPV